jgi:hypothetical protein
MSDPDLEKLKEHCAINCLKRKVDQPKWLCLMVLVHTGCRPAEAAYIVTNATIGANLLARHICDYAATCPEVITKTEIDYEWLLPKEHNNVWEHIQKRILSIAAWESLLHSLYPFYKAILTSLKIDKANVMRSIRCWHATEWVKLRAEYIVMGWKNIPPNPL